MNLKRLLVNIVLVASLMLASYLLYRVFHRYSLEEVVASIRAIPTVRLATSAAFAAASYACLTGFDWLGLRYAGKTLSYSKAAIASFTALSIGHNLGVAALSSGAVRYRFYSRWGLTTEEVAKVVLFCGVTVGLGLTSLAAIALLANPDDARKALDMTAGHLFFLGIGCAVIPVAYLVLAATVRAPLKIRRWRFQIPSVSASLAQVALGTLNFVFVSACLHQLISADTDAGFVQTVTAFVLANIAVLVTHVPGGLGVLEATVRHVLPDSASIGALVAFRAIYFLLPLALGLALLAISEMWSRLKDGRRSKDGGQPRPEVCEQGAHSA
jgi:uncharacterized membrane protein YbhN (UPF0104 family)